MIPAAWQQNRQQLFPVTRDLVYLDHAGVAPLCGPAADAIRQVAGQFSAAGAVGYDRWTRLETETRFDVGRLLGSTPRHVAWIPNTGSGLSFAAQGIDWQPGDVVILARDEFPANVYPWLALASRGVKTIFWDLGTDNNQALAKLDVLLDEHPTCRVVAYSWVQYHTGRVLPVAQVGQRTRDRDILSICDGIQGLGVIPFDFNAWNVDVVAADGHKWLLGPEGFGIAAFSDRAMERIVPTVVGWHSVRDPWNFAEIDWQLAEDASRYEPGSWNLLGIAGLGAAIRTILDAGIDAIHSHAMSLATRIRERFALPDPDWPSGPHTFVDIPDGFTLGQLAEHGIIAQIRGGRLRLAPHAYLSHSELETALDTIADQIAEAKPKGGNK